ncbi:MAG: lipoyl(octanoyl) transferase LipB [Deltaproteobacteria bacterium]|nr:lipoyl(octanoyl) transferase LipB [Deltaproteobacteria bacterium]MBW2332027.1 lipoyl(octanoyl) transferase LipB [Deltaproteobacteria bacterium]
MKCNILNIEGELEYATGLMLQKSALYNIKDNDAYDTLILLRHTPTITLGHFAKNQNILAPNNFLMKRGIQVHRTDRGGDVTYHGPGQLICYPIIDTQRKQLREYKSKLCQSLIDLLQKYNIKAEEGHKKLSGLWVGDKKIAAIGYALKKIQARERTKTITMHGFALNVLDEMENFCHINPCGMSGIKLTNMEQILGKQIGFKELKENYVKAFVKVFNYEIDE